MASTKTRHRLQPPAPIPVMVMGLVASLLLVFIAATFSLWLPWTGVTLAYNEAEQRPVVTKVHKTEPAVRLRPGDIVIALQSDDGHNTVDLSGFVPRTEPPSFSTFASHNEYLSREDSIAQLLLGNTVTFLLTDGRQVTTPIHSSRTLAKLPLDFWLFNLFGLLAWNIGLAVLAVRPGETTARLLALSGFGFFVATLFNSIYLSRELALTYELLLMLSRLNNIGLAIMLSSLLALMAYFPQKISRNSPVLIILPIIFLIQLNEWHQWVQWPWHTHYLPIFILYMAGVFIAIYQWRRSRTQPLDRAALKWMLLSIFIIMGIGLSIYFVPIAFTGSAYLPQWLMVGIASLLYVGFAFGIVRYRLFDVQRWWLKIWGWFLGGLLIIGLDLLMIFILQIQPIIALSVAVIAVGWVYFPIRQWGLDRLARSAGTDDRRLVDQVEKMAQTPPGRDYNSRWQEVLVSQFSPAGIVFDSQSQDTVLLERQGAVLTVPMISGEGALKLTYPDFGRRLFSLSDVKYVQSLYQISKRILDVHQVELQAVKQERQRIVRDLHDDVGGHLLSLLRQAPSETFEAQVRTALQALRDAMKAMDGNTLQRLEDFLEDRRVELEQRVSYYNIEFRWQQEMPAIETTISVRQAINLSRILSEGVSNALQHSKPGLVLVKVLVTVDEIELAVQNDGVELSAGNQDVTRGRGLNNMLTRASELGGQFEFTVAAGKARLYAKIPFILDQD